MKNYIFPYLPEPGPNDQDFSFMLDENQDQLLKNITGTEEDAIASIDKLLSKRPRSMRYIQEKTGHARELISRAVAKMVDKGKVQIDHWKEHKGTDEAQLKLNF